VRLLSFPFLPKTPHSFSRAQGPSVGLSSAFISTEQLRGHQPPSQVSTIENLRLLRCLPMMYKSLTCFPYTLSDSAGSFALIGTTNVPRLFSSSSFPFVPYQADSARLFSPKEVGFFWISLFVLEEGFISSPLLRAHQQILLFPFFYVFIRPTRNILPDNLWWPGTLSGLLSKMNKAPFQPPQRSFPFTFSYQGTIAGNVSAF